MDRKSLLLFAMALALVGALGWGLAEVGRVRAEPGDGATLDGIEARERKSAARARPALQDSVEPQAGPRTDREAVLAELNRAPSGLDGFARHADGRPLVGVRVEGLFGDGTATTDEEGRFTLPMPERLALDMVNVVGDGWFHLQGGRVFRADPGRSRPVVAERSRDLDVRVRTVTGRAVGGARLLVLAPDVEADPPWSPLDLRVETICDDEGRLSLERVPAVPELCFLVGLREFVEELQVTLPAPGETLELVVPASWGEPTWFLRVAFQSAEGGGIGPLDARVGDGAWSYVPRDRPQDATLELELLNSVLERPLPLVAWSCDGRDVLEVDDLRPLLQPASAVPTFPRLRFEPRAHLLLTVLDDEGSAFPDVRVTWPDHEGKPATEELSREHGPFDHDRYSQFQDHRTDEEGRFEFPGAPPRPFDLVLTHPDLPGLRVEQRLDPRSGPLTVRIEGWLALRNLDRTLVDASGRPWSGADLLIGPSELLTHEGPAPGVSRNRTDAEGRLRIVGLDPLRSWVRIEDPAADPTPRALLEPDGESHLVVPRLVHVRLRIAPERPVAVGARVRSPEEPRREWLVAEPAVPTRIMSASTAWRVRGGHDLLLRVPETVRRLEVLPAEGADDSEVRWVTLPLDPSAECVIDLP